MRTTVPGASTLGVTAGDVENARKERDRLQAAHDEAEAAANAELKAMKEAAGGTLPATAEVREKVKELFAETDKLGAELDSARDYLADMQGRLYGRDPEDHQPAATSAARGIPGIGTSTLNMTARLLASEAYKQAKAEGYSGLQAWREALGVAGEFAIASRAETMAVLSPLAAVTLEPVVGDDQRRLFPPVEYPLRMPRILDLITISETDKDQVDYAVTVSEDGAVTGAAFGTAGGVAAIVTEARTEAVKRRLSTLDVPEGVLSDEARLKTWLESRFRRWLRLDTEAQVVLGGGTGQDFTGIVNWSGVNTRQRDLAATPIAVTIHEGITDIRIAYEDEPNAVAFRPETWQELVTERSGSDGHYVNTGGPFGAMPTSIWGKQAVASTLLRDGTGSAGADPLDCIVGYWPEAELAVREGASIREFEQNKDNAEKGLVTIRGQYRAAFIVNQPVAFTVINLEPAA